MFQTIDRMLLASLGAVSMTRERAETIFDELVERGQAERGRKEGFVKELMATADRTRKDIERIIDKQVRQTVETMHLATREDLERVESKIDEVLAQQKAAQNAQQES